MCLHSTVDCFVNIIIIMIFTMQLSNIQVCEMASKRTAIEQPVSSSKKAMRQVAVAAFKKWQSQFEREYQSLSWLWCDVCEDNRGLSTCYCTIS